MSLMSDNNKYPCRNFSDSSQLTNWILDSRATFHMTLEVSDFIPGSLDNMDKNIEGAGGHRIMEKQKGQVQIKMCDHNRDTFITILYYVLLAPELCDRLFSIVTLINYGHTSLFHKGICTVYFG